MISNVPGRRHRWPEWRKFGLVGGVLALGLATLAIFHHAGGGAPRRHVPASADLSDHLRAADLDAGAKLFKQCAACHSIGRDGADLDGPNLHGVVGSAIAERRPRYGYSAALRRSGGTWTFARLDAWLTNPAAFAPGTRMRFAGYTDPKDRADVIAFLNAQGSGLPLP